MESVWLPASRQEAEKLSGDKFLTQTWEFTYTRFPVLAEDIGRDVRFPGFSGFFNTFAGPFKLPIRPVQSASIRYVDTAGVEQDFGTLNTESPASIIEWSLIRDSENPRIVLNLNQQWPVTAPVDHAVKVTIVAGYGDNIDAAIAAGMPPLYRAGMLLMCGHFYQNREAVVLDEGRVQALEIPLGIRDLLASPKAG